MDRCGLHRFVDEVRIIIGPKFDMLIKLDNDHEDLIFTEELIEHEVGKSHTKSKNMMCISLPVQAKDRRFILDSGSGHDLISARKAERMNLKQRTCDPIMFHTANGSTATQTEAEIDLGTFDMTSHAYVLDDTPSVMSLGKRCMEEGYSCVWPSGKMPFMITKDGERIDLTIHDNIPYVDLGTYECTPHECHHASKINDLLIHTQDDFSELNDLDDVGRPSRRIYLDGESGLETLAEDHSCSRHVKKLKKKKKRRATSRRKHAATPGEEEEPPEDGEYEPGTPYDGPPGDETDFEDDGHGAPEDAAEGDEDDIEIDVVEGESRVAKRGTLKREANSLNHKLTHRYKNPYCDSCIRAKMKHFKTRRGAYKRELKKFGDLITFDAVDTSKVHDDVLVLEKEVLVIRDCFTGIIGAYPSDRMAKDDVVRAVKQFIGAKKVRQAYSDHAPQFIEAMNEMKIPIDHSLPGRPQTNSIAERTNQFILTATSTCLLEAGLPPCFWRTAILCVCHLLNVEPNDDELSAWCKLHGSDFAGKLIPYGARVNYKPPKTREAGQLHKFGPDSIPGVFAGYHIGPGMHWTRQYKVWPLSEFVHQNLGDDASKPEHRLLKPHLTEKVEMVTPLTFPCKQEYERVNTTLEGMKERELLDGDPSKVPHGNDEEQDHDEDDDELDDGDDGGPGPSGGKVSKKPLDDSEDIFDKDKDPEEMTLQELIDVQPEHWKSGKAGDGKVYLNDDGEKVKLNVKGYPYKIGDDGRRLLKTSLRPKGTYSPEEWRKLSQSDRSTILKSEKKKLEKKEADDKAKRIVEEKKKKALKKEKKDSKKDKDEPKSKDDEEDDESKKDDSYSKSKKSDAGVGEVVKNKVTLPITCTSTYLDLYDIVDDDNVHGKRYIDCRKAKRNADASPCSDASTDVPDDEEYLTEWDEWSEVEKGRGPKASWSGEVWNTLSGGISRFSLATPGESTMIKNGKCVNVKDMKNVATDDDDEFIAFPTMPCTSASIQSHRTKIPPGGLGSKLFNAMVSRPVGRAEIESNPKAKEAMLKEWKGLRDQEVFDFTMVCEYDDVVAEAKKNKKEVHMARVHGICVEKNYQLSEDNPGRKFKGRGVLLGNQVKNQHWEAAFFQDLGNSPASFEASRWADFYGCLPGHAVKLADAIQAYIQAKLKGPLCWVELPTDAWPPEIQYWKFRRPVVRLDKALYGHPDSGTMWEQHCDKKVQEIGFKPIGEEWPSMYFHDELKLLLVIYVDDLKLAGPSENLAKGWEMLRTVLRIEPKTDLGLYLGCVLSQGETQLHNGKKVKTITYNMEGLLKLSVEKYLDIIGKDTKLKKVSTPSLPEETKSSPYRAPSDGKRKVECPWCAHSFDPEMPALPETGNSRPVIDGDKSCKVNQGVITLCTHCDELNTIPITDVFVPYQYHIEVGKHEVDHPKVSVILWREKKNRTLEFEFSKSPCDLMTSKFAKFSLAINLIEVPRAVPCFVLLCSEERNWFTFLQNKMKDEMKFHVVPITEDDDMLSPYGISKARRCLRTKLDSVFFAGPCTGGSPWNRINRWVSEATTQLIEAKKQIFWAMWEVFASVLSELINMGSPALLELPRGCDYWKDRRMTDLVEGTVSHEHKFDGCMYGLKSQFQETPKPIKKPWKIVTWGVSFPKLHRRCDRRHDHVECAGRETRITQVYTKWIAKIIMNGINDHVIRNSPFVNVKVMKRWKSLAFDEQLKAEMSRDSENVRSHPIKSVATSVCATRELDAIDHSFEQSLLHWCLSRLISTSVLSSWHIIFVSAAF